MMINTMKLSSALPLRFLRRVSNVNPLIINYHMVSDQMLPYVWPVYHYRNTKVFRQDLDFLCRHYNPLGMKDLIGHITTGTPIPEHSFMITFDDGFREVYDIAAGILSEKKIPATFFVTKNFVDNKEMNYDNKKGLIADKIQKNKNLRNAVQAALNLNDDSDIIKEVFNLPVSKRYVVDELLDAVDVNISDILRNVKPYMSSRQINKLVAEGFSIGGHSIDHPNFAELSLSEQVKQTAESIDFVRENFGVDYKVFAFPYSDRTISLDFFRHIEGVADLTFGTHGLHEDIVKTNLQRISVEKLPYPGKSTIKFFYFKKLIYSTAGKNTIKRR